MKKTETLKPFIYAVAGIFFAFFFLMGNVAHAGFFIEQTDFSGAEQTLNRFSGPGGDYMYVDSFPYGLSVGDAATSTSYLRDANANTNTSPTDHQVRYECWNGSAWVEFLTTQRAGVVGTGGILSDGNYHLVESYGTVDSDYASCNPSSNDSVRVQVGLGGIGPPNQGKTGADTNGLPYLKAEADAFIQSDGDTRTHVISINDPVLGATTTSPVYVEFDYYQGANSPTVPNDDTANGYVITATHSLNGAVVRKTVIFPSTPAVGTNRATTTIALTSEGTYTLDVYLIAVDDPDNPNSPTFNLISTADADPIWFALGAHDNWQTITFGPAYIEYASTSCMLSWSLDFNIADCAGYLFTPTQGTYDLYRSLPAQLDTKFPFVYVNQIGAIRQALFEASPTASTSLSVDLGGMGTITLISKDMIEDVPFTPVINAILTAFLYLFMAEFVYRKVLAIHDK